MVALRTGPIAHQTATVRRRWNAASAGTLPVAAPCGEPPISRQAGRVVAGRYRLRRLLGRGGMGTVWLANDLATRLGLGLLAKDPPQRLDTGQAGRALRALEVGGSSWAPWSGPHA
jgi:hypothetical protein